MKKITFILVVAISLICLFVVNAYALDMNLINSIRENEMESFAENLYTNSFSNSTNSNSPGIEIDLTQNSSNNANTNTSTSTNSNSANANNFSNTPIYSNSISSVIDSATDSELSMANILNILLLVVGVLLILLGIAIIIKMKK